MKHIQKSDMLFVVFSEQSQKMRSSVSIKAMPVSIMNELRCIGRIRERLIERKPWF